LERKLVTEKELLSLLNTRLRQSGENEHCYFESLVRLRVDDRTGCNWAYANLKGLSGADTICPAAAEQIVTRARAEYNLK
jgi:hypothetical protein